MEHGKIKTMGLPSQILKLDKIADEELVGAEQSKYCIYIYIYKKFCQVMIFVDLKTVELPEGVM